MQDFDEKYTYFVKDLVIEKLPISLNEVIEVEANQRWTSPPPFAEFVRDNEKDTAFSVTHHTLPVLRLCKGFIDGRGEKQHIRMNFAFCRKFEKILGMPINTILKERDDARAETKSIGNDLIKQACKYRALKDQCNVVKESLQEMTLFDRLMFVVDGYEYLELLFNMKYMKKHPYQYSKWRMKK